MPCGTATKTASGNTSISLSVSSDYRITTIATQSVPPCVAPLRRRPCHQSRRHPRRHNPSHHPSRRSSRRPLRRPRHRHRRPPRRCRRRRRRCRRCRAAGLPGMCGHRAAGTHTQAEIMPRSSEIVRFFAHLFIYNKPFQCCRMSQLAALGSKFAAVTCISQGASWFVRGRAGGADAAGGCAPVARSALRIKPYFLPFTWICACKAWVARRCL